ncbi:hypothetical protein PMI09_04429 [Rhizobium sp. CF122]|uniref:hypothetical protein n=1 Tax=Rhizobium sp. CF122 TaxID=1144312 RepID=UPI000271B1FA|nr:hypothetical protein [Rhizobium sp. CF122]EJL51639.1 hypothetical protein PMI09_04429 [Rhizobium sp. CF122]
MPRHHRITLYRSKLRDAPIDLTYAEETLRRSQKRFRNRRVLTPAIDLDAYQWGAVVDWIDIEFELIRRTQHWKLNDRIEARTGRKEFPEALDLGAGKTATQYRLRVQEPDFAIVRKVMEDIEAEYGLTAPARVVGLEVSIDAYPRTAGEEARARLHGVLVRHFFPTTAVLTGDKKWPRFVPGMIDDTDHIVGRNKEDVTLDVIDRMTPSTDRPVLYASTFYVGEKADKRALWRIQNKVLDKQNKAAGTREVLPEDRKRIRIEVALGPDGCREAGLQSFETIGDFKFTRLQKLYFQFVKPTFGVFPHGGAGAHISAVRRQAEETRRQRFLNAGVLGLQIREDAREELRRLEMASFTSWHKSRGSKMPRKIRTGAGPYGSMVAYEELARIVERALSGLQKRVRREMVRVGVR